jgi:hypothetical protein
MIAAHLSAAKAPDMTFSLIGTGTFIAKSLLLIDATHFIL